ncbi:DNA mismatch repair endonuclease MutL [Allobaculum sp. Allo2]|uniref:DNA mismatch repair endonuclease MutL n=1 Tax=Allobaculum sp. Allo2 TaxID=2853432 RepID=UPI001F6168FE|nr:DNA mismatch repair endonuclease MutL [Allobaculum sp. Allo2]UNT93634.1 DNA mismatch repair endonuclease MutL [Allobaculum sp. Allo2]
MGIIHVLDEQLTNMIAAGEVVDRPVNIVKECVENALDAGADSIDIEVFQGGIDGVIVTDNGCGMSFDDARMAFERHATSKIQSEDELFSISTMGFRGEALPSIASVARVSMTTADVHGGTRIVFDYGELILHEHADVPQGTRIEVRGLFLHTPARFKYLKKPNYEFAVIADAVNKIALAHPEVRFTLRHDNRLIFQTTGKSNRLEILFQMFGRDAASKAEAFEASSPDFKISGYALQPSVNRASKSYIYLCLNGRTIRSWPIVNAIVEGYREFLPRERYPVCFLNIETDFQLVDVNVHPNKLEVRISKEEYLADLIKTTIQSLFEEKFRRPRFRIRLCTKRKRIPWSPSRNDGSPGKPRARLRKAGCICVSRRIRCAPYGSKAFRTVWLSGRSGSAAHRFKGPISRHGSFQRRSPAALRHQSIGRCRACLSQFVLSQSGAEKLSDLTASDTPAQTAPVNPQNPAGEDLSPVQNPVSQTSVSAGEKHF